MDRTLLTVLRRTALYAAFFLLGACATAPDGSTRDASNVLPDRAPWRHGAMVSAANPYAVEAGTRILRAGGSAVDAAIATHAVLGLVEPQSSGLGGGAFLLAYDRDANSLRVYDGRETAPAGATPDMFIVDGKVMNFRLAWQSGVAVGVPGAVAMYKLAHDAQGKLPWADIFEPAIELAQAGFVVSPRLNNLLTRVQRFGELHTYPDSAAYFYPGGEPLAVGSVRKNPAYAATLRRVAAEGPSAFYTGEIATAIATAARAEPRPGTLTIQDLASYRAIARTPVCGGFRDYTVCSAPPPSSGLAQIMIAGLYDRLVDGRTDVPQDEAIRAFVDAQRLAYADRDHFVGDPAFADVPTRALIDQAYLDNRATERFAPDAAATHGDPAAVFGRAAGTWAFGPDTTQEGHGTTHLSIVDADGNAVTMTATVEGPFGSSRFVHGFLLNNEMTDFSRDPGADNASPANLVAPGKRSRSSMSPTLIFDEDGQLLMATGSPGGNSIVAYVAKSLLGVLAWNLPVQAAIDHPNIVARGDRVRVETATDEGKALAKMLKDAGYEVQEREGENSGLHTIVVRPDALEGGADPRREGVVRSP